MAESSFDSDGAWYPREHQWDHVHVEKNHPNTGEKTTHKVEKEKSIIVSLWDCFCFANFTRGRYWKNKQLFIFKSFAIYGGLGNIVILIESTPVSIKVTEQVDCDRCRFSRFLLFSSE